MLGFRDSLLGEANGFVDVVQARDYMVIIAFINSTILTVCSVTIVVVLAAMVAFVLQRRVTRWTGLINFLVLSGLTMSQRAQAFNQRWAKLGCDIDLSGLFFDGDRNDVVEYLKELGWHVSPRPRRELFADYGRVFPEDDTSQLRNIVSLTATR